MVAQPSFLTTLVADFAESLKAADAKRPQAVNQREEMRVAKPAEYASVEVAVPYGL